MRLTHIHDTSLTGRVVWPAFHSDFEHLMTLRVGGFSPLRNLYLTRSDGFSLTLLDISQIQSEIVASTKKPTSLSTESTVDTCNCPDNADRADDARHDAQKCHAAGGFGDLKTPANTLAKCAGFTLADPECDDCRADQAQCPVIDRRSCDRPDNQCDAKYSHGLIPLLSGKDLDGLAQQSFHSAFLSIARRVVGSRGGVSAPSRTVRSYHKLRHCRKRPRNMVAS